MGVVDPDTSGLIAGKYVIQAVRALDPKNAGIGTVLDHVIGMQAMKDALPPMPPTPSPLFKTISA